jgi:hypothetical protein
MIELVPFTPRPGSPQAWPTTLSIILATDDDPRRTARAALAAHLARHARIYTTQGPIHIADDHLAKPWELDFEMPYELDCWLEHARIATAIAVAEDGVGAAVAAHIYDPRRDRIAVVLDGELYLGEDHLDDLIARGQPLTGVCLPLVIDGDVARG